MALKYKVGDRVRIKSLDWYNENKNEDGRVACGYYIFTKDMSKFCGCTMIVCNRTNLGVMTMGGSASYWTDEMIEGLVEEENLIERVDDKGLPFNEWLSHKGAFYIPDGYELKDENGNVINAMKIVLEKKIKYPKTYEECLSILGIYNGLPDVEIYNAKPSECELFESLIRLKRCRDAYWKIAGEEMGLGKPWAPDYNDEKQLKYGLYEIIKYSLMNPSQFAFPTAEMRDAFKENFKEEIEICKELL